MTSTDSATTTRPPVGTAPASASGVDLARVALQAAKEAARRRGDQPGTGKPRRTHTTRTRTVRGDDREPRGLAAVFQQLITERAWEVPAAGGSVLQQWPTIAPDLAPHVKAAGFDARRGRLDLLPDSPAYATQVRMSTSRLIALANRAAGREAVRSIRVLPPGTQTPAPAVPEARLDTVPSPAEPGPVHTREDASAGYHQALAAAQAGKAKQTDPLAPAVQAAIERQDQVLRARREPKQAFADARELTEQLQNRARVSVDPQARALARARTEKAGHIMPSAYAQQAS